MTKTYLISSCIIWNVHNMCRRWWIVLGWRCRGSWSAVFIWNWHLLACCSKLLLMKFFWDTGMVRRGIVVIVRVVWGWRWFNGLLGWWRWLCDYSSISFGFAALPEDDQQGDEATGEHRYGGILVVRVRMAKVLGARTMMMMRWLRSVMWRLLGWFIVPIEAHGESFD